MSRTSKAAIAGVWPVEFGEAFIAQAFPSIAATALGRLLGRLYSLPFAIGFILHIVTLPIPVTLAVVMFLFGGFRRYTVSTTRARVRRGLKDKGGPEVLLSELEDVRTVVRPGQAFFRSADLELIVDGQVALTLSAVKVAEAFRHVILEARDAVVQVAQCHKSLTAVTAS